MSVLKGAVDRLLLGAAGLGFGVKQLQTSLMSPAAEKKTSYIFLTLFLSAFFLKKNRKKMHWHPGQAQRPPVQKQRQLSPLLSSPKWDFFFIMVV